MAAPSTTHRRRAPARVAEPARPFALPAASTSPTGQLVASAALVPLANLGWDRPRSMEPWQRELWRMLEIVGELKYAANWVASHASRAVLRMHDVGEDGELAGVTKNEKALEIAASIFGKPAHRREQMRMAAFNLWLVGETYIGALAGQGSRGKDQWFAISVNDIKRLPDGAAYVDLGNGKKVLRPGTDLLMRCWTPHPNKAADADSTARSVRIILRELEKLTLFIFAQIDSRLASGGVFVVPAGLSTADGNVTAQDLMASFVATAAEALKGEGTAAGIVPIVLEVPDEALGKLQYLTFSSDLSEKAVKLREEARQRLAQDLDIPAEELTGMGDTNHWSSYQIGPDGIKKHIEPLLARMCLALQEGWVDHALEAAGLDPDKFQLWYDTTPLVVRPQQFQEALELWREGRLSAEALLEAAGFYPGDGPAEEEDVQRYLRELVLRDPQLFNQASVRKLLGITEEMMPQESIAPAADPAGGAPALITDSKTPPPPPPAPEKVPQQPVTGRPPVSRNRPPKGVTASAGELDLLSNPLVTMAHGLSLRALELAGGRLLDHKTRGQLKGVPRSELHTRVQVTRETHDLDALLAGSVDALPVLAQICGIDTEMVGRYATALHDNCVATLLSGKPYDPARTITALRIAGVIDAL